MNDLPTLADCLCDRCDSEPCRCAETCPDCGLTVCVCQWCCICGEPLDPATAIPHDDDDEMCCPGCVGEPPCMV